MSIFNKDFTYLVTIFFIYLSIYNLQQEQLTGHRGNSEGSRCNALPGDKLAKVQEHIESFPVTCVHY